MAQPVAWSELRAILVLPPTLFALFLVALVGVTHVPVMLLFLIVAPVAIVLVVPALYCYGLLFTSLITAWSDTLGKGAGRRQSTKVRVRCAVILCVWLAVYFRFRSALWHGDLLFDLFVGIVATNVVGDVDAGEIWLRAFSLGLEWLAVIGAVWLLVELALPTPEVRQRGTIRGWCVSLLLAEILVIALIDFSVGHYQFSKFLASSDSVAYRVRRPGTIGEALCQGHLTDADERIGKFADTLRNDEVIRIANVCATGLPGAATSAEDRELRIRLIGSIARLVVAHGLAVDARGFCGEGADALLMKLYGDAFTPEYLASAKRGGLRIDCLAREDKVFPWREVKGEPIWWRSVGRSGTEPTDAIAEREKRLPLLKQLEIRLGQQDMQGRDLLSQVDVSDSNAWLEALVNEGLDPDHSSDKNRTPLRLLLVLRRYGMNGTTQDLNAALRLSNRIGDPSPDEVRQFLGRTKNLSSISSETSDEQQAQFWAWVFKSVGLKDTVHAITTNNIGEKAGPKLKELIAALSDQYQLESRADGAH